MAVYEIRIKGHLDGRWSEWFAGLEITNLENGEAVISGDVADQSALHGVLNKIRDLNLPLIAVNGVGPDYEQSGAQSLTTNQLPATEPHRNVDRM
jgi:hypothetical protein